MPILQSIEALDRKNIIETQNRPVIVHASDLNFYYCKYHGHVGTAHRLFKEYLLASFLSDWEFKQSPFSLVQVLPEHIPADLSIIRRSFDSPCFGLQAIEDVIDLNKVTEDVIAVSRGKISLRTEILKLSFFDIWTCNEDRHTANYNLLCKLIDASYIIYPIDHEACFNHQDFERGLDLIDYESSLIYSSFFSKLFGASDLKNKERLDNLKQTFYLCTLNCKKNTVNYLKNIPAGWNIDILEKAAELNRYLFDNVWFENCWNTFLEFIGYFVNK